MTELWVEHYHEHGYAIVPGVFDANEIADIAHQFDLLYQQGIAYGRSFRDRNSFFAVTDDAALGAIVRMVQWPSYFNATLERIRRDPRMLEIVAPLIGPDLKQIINVSVTVFAGSSPSVSRSRSFISTFIVRRLASNGISPRRWLPG